MVVSHVTWVIPHYCLESVSHVTHVDVHTTLYVPPGLLLSTCEPYKLSQAIGSNHPSYSNPSLRSSRSFGILPSRLFQERRLIYNSKLKANSLALSTAGWQ